MPFFNIKITGQGIFVHDYMGLVLFFRLDKSRGGEFLNHENHEAETFYVLQNHGAVTFLES